MEPVGYKELFRDPVDGRFKMRCDICGEAFSELELRNGVHFCRRCRLDDRIHNVVDKHIVPVVAELGKLGKEVLIPAIERALAARVSNFQGYINEQVARLKEEIPKLAKEIAGNS